MRTVLVYLLFCSTSLGFNTVSLPIETTTELKPNSSLMNCSTVNLFVKKYTEELLTLNHKYIAKEVSSNGSYIRAINLKYLIEHTSANSLTQLLREPVLSISATVNLDGLISSEAEIEKIVFVSSEGVSDFEVNQFFTEKVKLEFGPSGMHKLRVNLNLMDICVLKKVQLLLLKQCRIDTITPRCEGDDFCQYKSIYDPKTCKEGVELELYLAGLSKNIGEQRARLGRRMSHE